MFDLDAIVDNVDATRVAIFWRGQFVHRYGAVEFAICELLARVRLLDEYEALEALPFRWASKIKVSRQLLTLPGPVSGEYEVIGALLDQLPQFEVYRHLLVHGLMTAKVEDKDVNVALKSYDHVKGDGLGLVSLDLPLSQLITLCDLLAPVSANFTATVARICKEVPLPQLSADPPKPISAH